MNRLLVLLLSLVLALPAQAWRSMHRDSSPFLEQQWLGVLESTRSVHPESGWLPFPVGLYEADELVAAAPAYAKAHSMGEFVYDWSWAAAAERMGLAYYPKLVVGSPFSPVSGQRLLLKDSSYREPLIAGLIAATDRIQASGLHVQFCTEQEALDLRRHALQVVAVADGAQEVAHAAVLVGAMRRQHGE